MKKAVIFFIFSLSFFYSSSQNKQVLFDFEEIPQSLMLNPGGIVDYRGYVGVPLLSQIYLHAASSGISVYDIFAEDHLDFSSKLRKALGKMDAKDHFAINQQFDLLSGGFSIGANKEKLNYISFGIYQELDFLLYLPKDIADFALYGTQDRLGKAFQFEDINASGEVLTVFHLGLNKRVNPKLTLGVRGKVYSSILNIKSIDNSGYYKTAQGMNNFYNHILHLDVEINTSGIASLEDENDIEGVIRKRALLGGNLGFGLDLGATYELNEQWTFQASLLDLGFISHSKDVENYVLDNHYEIEKLNPDVSQLQPGDTAQNYWEKIEEDFETLFDFDSTSTRYTSWRPIKFNASASYSFEKKRCIDCNYLFVDQGYLSRVGAQLHVINRPKAPLLAITTYYYRRIFDFLRAKLTYTADTYSFKNIGFGFSADLWGFHIYATADNLLNYQNLTDSKSLSLQFGFNYLLKKR